MIELCTIGAGLLIGGLGLAFAFCLASASAVAMKVDRDAQDCAPVGPAAETCIVRDPVTSERDRAPGSGAMNRRHGESTA
jgi:hypothetical protein